MVIMSSDLELIGLDCVRSEGRSLIWNWNDFLSWYAAKCALFDRLQLFLFHSRDKHDSCFDPGKKKSFHSP